MCHNCLQSLQNQFNIISTLLDTNDKINDYISYKNNKDNVNLRNVLEFTTGVKRENESSITKFSTKEEEEIFEDVEKPETYIKMEEDIFLKEEPEYTFVDG